MKETPIIHTKRMEHQYSRLIENSVKHSKIYTNYIPSKKDKEETPKNSKIILERLGTVDAIIKYRGENPDKKIAALNFANYNIPGGGFIYGAIAQEECLCQDSFLYNVLTAGHLKKYYNYNNAKIHINKCLYENRAIYSPSIRFFDKESGEGYSCDVISCAAPNYNSAKMQGVTKEENIAALKSRIKFVLDIASAEKAEILILGAFGCGVFGQDAATVASIFKEYIKKYNFTEVIFAVIPGPNADVFDEVLSKKEVSTDELRMVIHNLCVEAKDRGGLTDEEYKVWLNKINCKTESVPDILCTIKRILDSFLTDFMFPAEQMISWLKLEVGVSNEELELLSEMNIV